MVQHAEENGRVHGPVLEADGICKRFPGVLALDDVHLALRPGEVHALVGENGAGKSTLINVVSGVHRPDAGQVRFQGRPAEFATPIAARRAGISTIHQDSNLVPMMSVARNLLLGREPRNRLGLVDLSRMYEEAEYLLAGYGIAPDVRLPLHSLGVGTRQMVALARAVSIDAKVVVMDEPTSSLELREVETLFDVIRDLRAKGIAVVYVSHRLDELYQICDRATVLRDGKVAHEGPMAELERLRLVSLMLGREMRRIREQGRTEFSGTHARAADGPVLEAHGLTRRNLLRDVSVTVRPGEVVGLGGLLGAGRTETAKAMIGAQRLDSGRVIVAGAPLRRRSVGHAIRAGLSLLPEDRKSEGIVPTLSVRENIALAALPRMSTGGVVSSARVDRVVETFMTRLRIKATSPYQKVSELSGGNQQKVLLARWLAMQPKALLLDEPTRGIDVGAKADVQGLIDDLAAEGLGVLLISSDLEELVEGSDRVVVLRDGRVVEELVGDEVTEEQIVAAIAGDETRERG